MLDSDTKRRINTCRDILVGKVPDPKSQVEQITIALIYKFMDDMDLEAEEIGGQRSFFTGEFERYRFSKLVAPGVGGQEMLNLYTEALTKMVENPDLPELFRSIFRNAYLPYRDPETLRSFLREINGFTYDHSERLGDAFEYLLSVLGSQGDAGQFRTPRHIIDFMVEIIDPKKTEVVLDPACGTAGFLISAYKHILKQNTTGAGNGNDIGIEGDAAEQALESPQRYKGDLLSPDERARLARNIKGYDISPDMVRLSRVNMFLHAFKEPLVEEYDTLTSDDKWGETADVILANPPFMSPKGGIIPHNKFQVPSKRSEVLFVDYIAEHLTPNGRAAIVVPEGIIFQTQSAYIALRKMLVEKHLAAVISLPSGVFNPYSGVKTSILILDRALAKASNHIAFFKIENDGFGLGTQRKAVKGSQLAQVKAELGEWLRTARLGGGEGLESSLGRSVERVRIADGGGYNLSSDRYDATGVRQAAFPLVPLSELLSVQNGFAFKSDRFSDHEGTPIIRIRDIKTNKTKTRYVGDYDPSYLVGDGDLLIGMDGEFNCTLWSGGPALLNQRVCKLHSFHGVEKEYLARLLPKILQEIEDATYAVTVKHISAKQILGIEIPLPPPEVQHEIVAEIEGYQRIIDGALAVLENYRPHIPIALDWPEMTIGDVARIARGASPRPIDKFLTDDPEGLNWIKIGDVSVGEKYVTKTKDRVIPEGAAKSRKVVPGDLILSNSMSFGRPYIVKIEGYIHDGWLLLSPDPQLVLADYLQAALASEDVMRQFRSLATGGVVNNLNSSLVAGVKIRLPTLEAQEAIVAEIEAEQTLVNGNRDLIARFEKKIDAAIARVWGQPSNQEAA